MFILTLNNFSRFTTNSKNISNHCYVKNPLIQTFFFKNLFKWDFYCQTLFVKSLQICLIFCYNMYKESKFGWFSWCINFYPILTVVLLQDANDNLVFSLLSQIQRLVSIKVHFVGLNSCQNRYLYLFIIFEYERELRFAKAHWIILKHIKAY